MASAPEKIKILDDLEDTIDFATRNAQNKLVVVYRTMRLRANVEYPVIDEAELFTRVSAGTYDAVCRRQAESLIAINKAQAL